MKFFRIHWTTTALNRLFLRWSSTYTRFFNAWFTLGTYVTLVFLPIAVALTLYATVEILFMHDDGEASQKATIEPVIPGVNLPVSELGYYSATLVFCSIFHEAGHALAAVREDVHIINVGLVAVFIVPIAFVNISSDQLKSLNGWKILKIMCAGVWHNLVLAVLAYLAYLIAPLVFALCFYVNSGISVVSVDAKSPLIGDRGVNSGDIITRINHCTIRDEESWNDCLFLLTNARLGFCVNTDVVHALDESVPIRHFSNGGLDCCGADKTDRLCFEYLDNNDGVAELPPYMCLPVRRIMETFNQYCSPSNRACPDNLHCIHPLLPNATTLMQIKRLQKSDIIYIGHPMDILYTINISPFIPNYVFSTTHVPDTIMKVLRYVMIFSLGLGLVNLIPCIYMDGQHIAKALAQIALKDRGLSKQTINLVALVVTCYGTSLLLFHCVYTIWVKMFK